MAGFFESFRKPKPHTVTDDTPQNLPFAEFIGSPTTGSAPLTVQFTDQSTHNPTSWDWDYRIKGGSWFNISHDQNPTYAFPPGTYDVRLTVTNSDGADATIKTAYVTVSESVRITAEPGSDQPVLPWIVADTRDYPIIFIKCPRCGKVFEINEVYTKSVMCCDGCGFRGEVKLW
jgi:PKD repeat protein